MKLLLILALVFITSLSLGQDVKLIEKDLICAFQKIDYWRNLQYNSGYDPAFDDSLDKANTTFERLLLKYTSNNGQTLRYQFKNLVDSGLTITTSEDGLFRIYSWDTQTGGTMHNFENVFQFESNKKVFSKTNKIDTPKGQEGDPGCSYYQINDVISENTKFYIAESLAILSSGYYYYTVQLFSINDSKLNDKAKLIKTQTGIKNQLGYEVDLTASVNRGRDIPDVSLVYDKTSKAFAFPLIDKNYKITNKKIKYKFTGKYFVRQ